MGPPRKKPRQESQPNLRQWEERGFRVDLQAILQKTLNEPTPDPAGEEAYQKAFLTGFEQSGRVPNPEYFPNSPSAQEYIKRRDNQIFRSRHNGAQQRSPPPRAGADSPGTSAILDRNRLDGSLNYQLHAHSNGSSPSPMYGSQSAQSPRSLYEQPASPIQGSSQGSQHIHQSRDRLPLSLEPQAAPMGPPRMLK